MRKYVHEAKLQDHIDNLRTQDSGDGSILMRHPFCVAVITSHPLIPLALRHGRCRGACLLACCGGCGRQVALPCGWTCRQLQADVKFLSCICLLYVVLYENSCMLTRHNMCLQAPMRSVWRSCRRRQQVWVDANFPIVQQLCMLATG